MSVKPILVSFLDNYSATELIQNPIPIPYTEEAINKIIELTNNQPFLIQVICQELVEQYNQYLRQGTKIKSFTLEQVESIVNNPQFFSPGSMANGYFNGVWEQTRESEPKEQINVLYQLCEQPLSMQELSDRTQLNLPIIEQALKTLQEHDIIKKNGKDYSYTVELMRHWVSLNRPQ